MRTVTRNLQNADSADSVSHQITDSAESAYYVYHITRNLQNADSAEYS